LKILIFYQYFTTPKGSWSTRVYELCRRWAATGYEVTVVTAPYEKSDIKAQGFISRQHLEGIELIVINAGDSNRLPVLNRVVRALTFASVAVFYALRLRYDVLIASSGPITIGLPLIAAKLLRRKPTVFEVRDLWPAGGIEMGLIRKKWQQRLALWFERLCYRQSDAVVTASVGQKNHIAKRFPDLNIEVIPNASDLELFGTPAREQLPDWAKGKRLFTHIGSLGYIHNMKYWMEVARALNTLPEASDILFVFIGDGAEREMLEGLKSQWKLDNVVFLGLKPKAELPVWVQNSVATLFATLDNPVQNTCSPNKIFDSFAAGVPIVQTSTGWIQELVAREKCGKNVPLDNPQLAARIIAALPYDTDALKEMSSNAKRLAETAFNRDILAEKYLGILADVRTD
jgi:glycosyltransferase involved in cell wall biosynthesis